MRIALAIALLLGACGDPEPEPLPPRVRKPGEPRRVIVERILISYRGNPFGIESRYSLEDAEALARRVYRRARSGEDFRKLRNDYSQDRTGPIGAALGPYIVLNYGVKQAPTMPHVARMLREGLGHSFGDIAFQMAKDEIALVEYDERLYPAGFEILLCRARDDRTEAQVEEDLKKPR
ncbi:MAG: peptidylprolyl isomerase [Planctomycetota bacterium]